MENYQRVRLSELISQNIMPEKITDTKNERYITVSLYGKGVRERVIKDDKYPVPFVGYRVSEGQFIYSRIDARNGAYGIIEPELNGFVVSKDFPVYDINTGRVLPQYLLLSVMGEGFLRQVKNSSFGATNRMRIKEEVLEDYSILLPPIEEQVKIAKLIGTVQSILELLQTQLRTLDSLIKARFVEMFGEQQATVKLSDVAEVTGGLTKNANRNKLPLRMPYLRVANVSFAKIDVTEMLDIGLTEDERTKTLLQFGDLLFVEGNGSPDQIGRVAVWHDEITPCVHQNHIIKARFDKTKMLPAFAMYYFMSQEGRDQIKRKAVSTSGLYTLSVSKIADFSLPCPSIAEQMEFDLFTTQVDKSKVVETIVRIRKHLASCGKARNLFRNQKLSHRNTRVQMHTFEYKVCA